MTSTQFRRLLDGEVVDHQDIVSLSLCSISALHLWDQTSTAITIDNSFRPIFHPM